MIDYQQLEEDMAYEALLNSHDHDDMKEDFDV